MKKFVAGFLLGAFVIGTGATWLILKMENRPVMFPSKLVLKYSDGIVFEGSIYGEGDADERPANNYIRGDCSKTASTCKLASMDEIGNGHIGAMWVETIPIRSWNENLVVADSKGLSDIKEQCNWYQIKIDIRTERITYTRYPNEHAKPACSKFSSEKIHRWRIDNGLAWMENADGTKRQNN